MFYLKFFWKSYARERKNNANCKKKYTNFLHCFLLLFFTKVCILNMRRDKTQTFLTETYLLHPKRPVGWLLNKGML